MPKALIISSVFPPLGSAGSSIRLVKLLKYLSLFGWKFTVYTQDIQRPIVPEQFLSGFLLEELPAEIEIKRIAAPVSNDPTGKDRNLAYRLLASLYQKIVKDSALPWGIRVLWDALQYSRTHPVDLVFGTAPPFTNALIIMLLGKFGRKPFVLDLRDDWVGLPAFLRKSIMRQKVEILLEGLIVAAASAVITVTPQSHVLYKNRYAHLKQSKKFFIIPNGCDLAEYEPLKDRQKKISSSRFLILSAASRYKKGHRDITPFLEALHAFYQRRPERKENIDIVLLGNSLSTEYNYKLRDLDLENKLQLLNVVGREELLEWMWRADLLLLIQPLNNTTAISGTLYEYWATGKAPVLLISETGASSSLVEDNRIGRHFLYDQIDEIAGYIEYVIDAYERGAPIWIEQSGIQKYDRKTLAAQMDQVWKRIVRQEE